MKAVAGIGVLIVGGLAIVALAASAASSNRTSEHLGPPDEHSVAKQEAGGELEVRVTPEMRRHSLIRNVLYFAGTMYGFGVLIVILATGLSRKMREVCRQFRRPAVAAMVYFALFTGVTVTSTFPLSVGPSPSPMV